MKAPRGRRLHAIPDFPAAIFSKPRRPDRQLRSQRAPRPGRAPSPGSPRLSDLDSWIAIAADGSVTAYSGKEELGQGISTAQKQLVAEELCVPFDRVNLIYCDTALTPDQAYTSGSQSHPANFNHGNLAQACATAREALLKLASEPSRRPRRPANRRRRRHQRQATHRRTSPTATWSAARNSTWRSTTTPSAKIPPQWTILGKPIPRPDLPAMATGQFEFVQNVRVPGMLHGRVVRPPAVGATLIASTKARSRTARRRKGRGQEKFRRRRRGKALAGHPGRREVEGDLVPRLLPARITKLLRPPAQPEAHARHRCWSIPSDVEEKCGPGRVRDAATYHHPYQMHGSMGSSCAVADVQGDKATIWSPTQGVWYQRNTCAMLLGIKPENVHVIFGAARAATESTAPTPSPTTPLCSRKPSASPCACSSRAKMKWPGKITATPSSSRARRPRRQGQHHRLGSRILVPDARQSPGPRHSRQRDHRFAARLRARGVRPPLARARPADATTTAATASRLTSPAKSGAKPIRHGNHQKRARPPAQRPLSLLDRPAALARAPAKHLRARMLHG